MQTFKLRASASGKLMTSPRNKAESLSETTKSYLKEWATEQIYGFRKEIKNKYLSKGLKLEDTAIDKAIEWLDLPLVLKNEKHFEDDYFKGTPDLILNDTVYDIKCSWDAYTFPLFDEEVPTKDYFYQLQVYMWLTGCRKAVLTYVLLNTPDELTYEEKITYDHLDKKYRIKTFAFDFDQSVIESLIERVKESRNYLETLIK